MSSVFASSVLKENLVFHRLSEWGFFQLVHKLHSFLSELHFYLRVKYPAGLLTISSSQMRMLHTALRNHHLEKDN